MAVVFKNNANTVLTADISSSATSISVQAGNVFPSLSAGEYFLCTIDDDTNNEIVKVTAISGNTLTVVRAQEGTTARAFSTSNTIEARLTAGIMNVFPQLDGGTLTADTDTITEGSTNLYYTDARAQAVSINNVVEDTSPQLGGTLDTNDQLIQFGDSSGETVNRLQFGASQDLQIYHNGSHSNIRDVGTGNLYIDGSASINFRSGDAGETYAVFNDDGAVSLYYNNSQKIATNSTGIDISGNLLLDSDNTEINLKGGAAGTTAKINWTFNTTGTDYASISLPYDTRATTGLHIDSGYPITIDATTRIDFDISGSTKMSMNTSGLNVTGAVTATSFSDGTISGITFIDEDSFATNSATRIPTQQSIKAYVDTQVAGVVDSAPAALDTLNELAAALGDDANFSTTTSTALGNRLRVDTASQGLTGTQQANAITNLGITATKAELNYVDGVTSNIQTQLNGKQATGSYLTGNQTITLSGDVSGSGTTSIAVTIADDSHNHVISNVDGLQTALNAKLASSSYTAADVLTKIKTVDGAGSGLDADLLDGISSASFLRSDASDTFTTLSGTTINLGSQVSLAESSHRADLLAITSSTSSWGGITIANSSGETLTSFMGNGNDFGIYDDLNDEWALLCTENSEVRIYHNGSEKLATTSGGIDIVGNITLSGTVDGRDIASDGSKLDGIESGATADQTAAQILTAIKTVDGPGSGLDADTLDGLGSGSFLRSDATDTFTTLTGTTLTVNGVLSVRNAIDLADNDILRFGSSDDVEFFCNGSHMYTDLNSGIGNWYIRDGTTTRFTFDDAGHFTATGNVTAYSDERLKDNIVVIDGALEKVSQLRGVTFDRTDAEEPLRQTGVIAQEVEKVLPEAVITAEDEMQTKSVAYGNMVGLLIEAIKELKTEVDDLKQQLNDQKKG